ncbi:MAG TPA: hypothetical protein VFX98_01220 [Longimicrobiaceae bacterium]|nr:hypothetical protein [Longimicrobiaceae bacterium]
MQPPPVADLPLASPSRPSPAAPAPPRADPFAPVLAAALLAAVAVSLAPFLPRAARLPLLAAALAAWTVLALAGGVGALAAGARTRREGPPAFAWIGAAGIAMAAVLSVQLEAERLLFHRPALIWNVDWSFALMHARMVAQDAGTERALDYAGAPVHYHLGPAWLAGAVGRLAGRGTETVLFGLVPLLSVATAAAAGLRLLRALTPLTTRTALLAVGVALTFPGAGENPSRLVAGVARAARHLEPAALAGDWWPFGPWLMLQSYFGYAVGLAAVAVLLDRGARRWERIVAVLGFAAVTEVKPQFLVGFGAFLGVVALARAAGPRGWGPRDARPLAAAALVVALAALRGALSPAATVDFAAPRLAPADTGYGRWDPLSGAVLVAAAALAVLFRCRRRGIGAGHGALALPVGAASAALLAVWAVLVTVAFPVRGEVLRIIHALGFTELRATVEAYNLAQSLIPLRFLAVLASAGALAAAARWRGPRATRWAAAVAACVVLSPLAWVVRPLAHPARGYEAVEDDGLRRVLAAVPVRGTLLAANDLAHPAEDYQRSLRNFLIPAYHGHQAYVASLRYRHFHPDAPARLAALRRLYETPWSAWHGGWLARTGMTHLLVSERCPVAWAPGPGVPLREVARAGRWVAYRVEGAGPPAPAVPEEGPPEGGSPAPRYGRSECLGAKVRAPSP